MRYEVKEIEPDIATMCHRKSCVPNAPFDVGRPTPHPGRNPRRTEEAVALTVPAIAASFRRSSGRT